MVALEAAAPAPEAEAAPYQAVALSHGHADVVRLHQAYRDRYGFAGPRQIGYGSDARWVGIRYRDRIVAVFSERDCGGGVLAIDDAYCEPTKAGWQALLAGGAAYYARLQRGEFTAIRHAVLWANKRFLNAVAKYTGDQPVGIQFEHQKKGA